MCNTTEIPETVTINLSRYESLKKDSKALYDFMDKKYTLIAEEYGYSHIRILKGSDNLDAVQDKFTALEQDNSRLRTELNKIKYASLFERIFKLY